MKTSSTPEHSSPDPSNYPAPDAGAVELFLVWENQREPEARQCETILKPVLKLVWTGVIPVPALLCCGLPISETLLDFIGGKGKIFFSMPKTTINRFVAS